MRRGSGGWLSWLVEGVRGVFWAGDGGSRQGIATAISP